MRSILFTTALMFMCCCGHVTAEIEPRALIIHLSPQSPIAQQWLASGRTGSMAAIRAVIGEHTTQGYISGSTLIALAKARSRKNSLSAQGPASTLDHIAVVRYSTDLTPHVAARKLLSIDGIEFCEPLPKMRLVGSTNDPLLPQQYHIELIQANSAWDSLGQAPTIVVGIADTGIDTTHQDLQQRIWNNTGETGQDNLGRDKRNNGIDDDANGYIDDWFGWDFVGANGFTEDNSPLPGNRHGTHVAGIVGATHNNALGIAGVARNVALMPLKIGGDDQFSTSISRSADAILYAASMGAHVINCSFGSPSSSLADQKIVNEATALGSIIVGAAGNDGREIAYYPAAYDAALCVAATDFGDRVASFSNINASVDVCAPGVSIVSTVPIDRYEAYDGTSMASPVVAAIAAMVRQIHPDYTPAQVHATLQASCVSIDSINRGLRGLIGSGRVDAAAAVSGEQRSWATVSSYRFSDADADSVFESSDTLLVDITILNTLQPLKDCIIQFAIADAPSGTVLLDSSISAGPLESGESRLLASAFRVVLPPQIPGDAQLRLLTSVFERQTFITMSSLQTIVNPTYRTIAGNDITVTVNSTGNIGFNDYSTNIQGVGLRYRDFDNILFEGATLIGTGPDKLPNAARGFETSQKETSFSSFENAIVRSDSIPSGLRVRCGYDDTGDFYPLGIQVRSNVIALNGDSTKNTLLVVLRVTNITDSAFSDLHVSQFFDFDIGDAGANDQCVWDANNQLMYISNTVHDSLPHIGLAMISPLAVNGFAMDNEGSSDCPSIYDEFLRSEKWYVMTGGIRRPKSRVTDVSAIVGAGPMKLLPDSTLEVCFALVAGTTQSQVQRGMGRLRSEAKRLGFNVGTSVLKPTQDEIIEPAQGSIIATGARDLRFVLHASSGVTIDLLDVQGRSIGVLYQELYVDAGEYEVTCSMPTVSPGIYIIRMITQSGVASCTVMLSSAN